jgi:GxxExxY protein
MVVVSVVDSQNQITLLLKTLFNSTLLSTITEKIYQEALSIELQQQNIVHIMEQVIPIQYKGIQIGGNHSMRIDICLQSYLDLD